MQTNTITDQLILLSIQAAGTPPKIFQFTWLSIYLYIFLLVYPCIHLSFSLYFHLSIISIYQAISFINVSMHLSLPRPTDGLNLSSPQLETDRDSCFSCKNAIPFKAFVLQSIVPLGMLGLKSVENTHLRCCMCVCVCACMFVCVNVCVCMPVSIGGVVLLVYP